MKKNFKVSLITVCMGRKEHIKQTLPKNIEDNIDYDNIEFVLLDYNSRDNLKKWVKENMSDALEKGILKYYHTSEPEYFHRSHSRNMAFRLATGEILCNVDADNYIGAGYAHYISSRIEANENSFLVYNYNTLRRSKEDFIGRVCCRRQHYLEVGGYDENFVNYGYEDLDLYQRLKKSGREEVYIDAPQFFNAILHDDIMRQENEYFSNQLQEYYICHISPIQTKVLCLFKDKTYEEGTLINTDRNYTVRILEKKWSKGEWFVENERLYLQGNEKKEFIKPVQSNYLIEIGANPICTWLQIPAGANLLTRHTSYSNFESMLQNKSKSIIKVNEGGFGNGKVQMNFSKDVLLA